MKQVQQCLMLNIVFAILSITVVNVWTSVTRLARDELRRQDDEMESFFLRTLLDDAPTEQSDDTDTLPEAAIPPESHSTPLGDSQVESSTDDLSHTVEQALPLVHSLGTIFDEIRRRPPPKKTVQPALEQPKKPKWLSEASRRRNVSVATHVEGLGDVLAFIQVNPLPDPPPPIYDNSATDKEKKQPVPSMPAVNTQVGIPTNYSVTAPTKSSIPWSNVSTLALFQGHLRYGLRNQVMALTMIVFHATQHNQSQILLPSILPRDTHSSNQHVRFAKLWDVRHWNSYYPQLPRLVEYDALLHSQFNNQTGGWERTSKLEFGTEGIFVSKEPSRPFALREDQAKLVSGYQQYVRGKGPYAVQTNTERRDSPENRHKAEILLWKGALRPHPSLQAIVDKHLKSTLGSNGTASDFMTLHARVEPAAERIRLCHRLRVSNLTRILEMVQDQWKDPPASQVFIPIDRLALEEVAGMPGHPSNHSSDAANTQARAQENLRALDRANEEGLWNGRVRVVELGSEALEGTKYAEKPGLAGAILDFYLGVHAKIFVGTERSSFSHGMMASRFYQGHSENYYYLPNGIHHWTPPGTKHAPSFRC